MISRIALALALTTQAAPAQTCYPDIRRSAPDERFVINATQGTVLDTKTGLTWKRCIEGWTGTDCAQGSSNYPDWNRALSQASASTFAGYTDWRLPNVKELVSLVEVACFNPAINATVFPNVQGGTVSPNTPARVWTSSPYAAPANDYYASTSWAVAFGNGGSVLIKRNSYYDGYPYAVRLVRGGQ